MNYELVYILSPKSTDEEAKKKAAEIKTMVSKAADKVTTEDFWGKRELAYPIDHYDNGYYVVVQFTDESGNVNDIDKNLRLTDEVIRFLLVKKDKVVKKKRRANKSTAKAIKSETKDQKIEEPQKDSDDKVVVEDKKTSKSKTDLDDLDKKLDDILSDKVED